jgi:DNA-binding LytR/AlgR family response regulator
LEEDEMKYTLHITDDRDEEIIIYARHRSDLTDKIEKLVYAEKEKDTPLIGYLDSDIIKITPEEVYCFFIEDKKLYASLKKGDALIKKRLYEVEETLNDDFVKINQSTVANMKLVDRFSVSIGATLTVHFKNGRKDYVSRRQMRAVKERLGI